MPEIKLNEQELKLLETFLKECSEDLKAEIKAADLPDDKQALTKELFDVEEIMKELEDKNNK